jgi:hypothetical protein
MRVFHHMAYLRQQVAVTVETLYGSNFGIPVALVHSTYVVPESHLHKPMPMTPV